MAQMNPGTAAVAQKRLKAIDGGAALKRFPQSTKAFRSQVDTPVPEDFAFDVGAQFAALQTTELTPEFDSDHRILWVRQQHHSSSSITPRLLEEIRAYQDVLTQIYRDNASAARTALKYIVWMSERPGVFNLGGELSMFARLVQEQDREGLQKYATDCVDAVFATAVGYGLPVVNVALVQGDALGGGFESILPYDVIVAERNAKFGLPEIIFGLFPGMGAYSFLARRIGVVETERLIRSGKIYTAEELHEIGVVDVLADDGYGVERVIDYVSENIRRHRVDCALYSVRRRVNPVSYEELMDIAEIWVETAMAMDESDIRKMVRLAEAQERRLNAAR